ncbi:MAG: EAL domain-containing protein, partial [Rhodocyclaceae bacterium]|nr:EAL domain-containing protein [Rhodocyclaceae bacterium]
TGLPNRQFLSEMAVSALERAQRLQATCAVLHVDLDRFKSVNDAFGDPTGDEVLQTIAGRVVTCVRAADLASVSRSIASSQVVARIGGDAFTILLLDIRGPDDAIVVADRILAAVSEPVTVGGREVVLTASIGIALFPRDGEGIDVLTRHAEQAMYVAKTAGRACYRFFDDRMNIAASSKLEMENDLRRALACGELRLHYQPQVDVESGRVVGAEALIRWQHRERGLLPPGEFIPLAEESGLIVAVGDWVLRTACRQARAWMDAGLPAVPVSINLSSLSFMQETLVEDLDVIVLEAGVGAEQVTLEVTESLLMHDLEHTIARLKSLRARGFGLSLDDFGTGYSSLSYLKRFPVDELKIDRSFVRDSGKGALDSALVASIIGLGRQFGLRVVAEGVETRQQSEFLLSHGCALQQGFLFARPMPAEAFEAYLRDPDAESVRQPVSGAGPAGS